MKTRSLSASIVATALFFGGILLTSSAADLKQAKVTQIVKDVNGNPMEVIIPWEECKKIEESQGLDLTQEAIEDLKQAKIDRDNANKDAQGDLQSI